MHVSAIDLRYLRAAGRMCGCRSRQIATVEQMFRPFAAPPQSLIVWKWK